MTPLLDASKYEDVSSLYSVVIAQTGQAVSPSAGLIKRHESIKLIDKDEQIE